MIKKIQITQLTTIHMLLKFLVLQRIVRDLRYFSVSGFQWVLNLKFFGNFVRKN